jgi:ABC-type multidrug transport system permease subunit
VAGLLIETSTLVWRRLHHLRKTPWRLISVALNPLILIIALGYLFAHAITFTGFHGVYMDYLLAGVSAQAALQNIGPTAIAIRSDLDKGLFDRFRSLPMGRSVVLFAHSIADSIIGVAGLLIVVFGGFLAGWHLGTGVGGFVFGLLVLVVFTYVCVWMGIGVGLCVKNLESIESIAVSLTLGLSFLSNALLAPGTLPQWLQPFAEWNPVSAVATSVRQAWGNPVGKSASIAGDIPLLAAGIFFALVLLVVPVLSQRRYRKSR